MDQKATGQLICQARKKKGLTQKQLAQQLNLSDRTISRWERGVGFPDISLLEPLSDALDIPILDLLRGEQREETTTSEEAAKETLEVAAEQREQDRRQRRKNNFKALALFLLLLILLLQTGLLFRPVSFVAEAGVYENGLLTDSTYVKIRGKIIYQFPFRRRFVGQIQTTHAQTSMSDNYIIRWRFDIRPGEPCRGGTSLQSLYKYNTFHQDRRDGQQNLERPFFFSFFMTDFAFRLTDGRVIATSGEMYTQLADHLSLPELQKPRPEPEY